MRKITLIILLSFFVISILQGTIFSKETSSLHWFAGVLIPCPSLIPPNLFVGTLFGLRVNRLMFKFEPNIYTMEGWTYSACPAASYPFTISYAIFNNPFYILLGAGICYGHQQLIPNYREGVAPLLEVDFIIHSKSGIQFNFNGKYFPTINFWSNNFLWFTGGVRFEW